ncbi:MAG: MBOAT family O-acyltransferase, partial [Gemmatimonadales bacterium]
LRDYLYIPLGGNRKGEVRRHVNLAVTMLLGGLWHGAGWTFVIWGGLHGAYLVVNHFWQAARQKLGFDGTTRPGRVAARAFTFLCVVLAWVFFRADSFSTAWTILGSMFLQNGLAVPQEWASRMSGDYSLLNFVNVTYDGMFPNGLLVPEPAIRWIVALALIAWFGPNTQELMSRYRPALGFRPADRKADKYRWLEWRPSYLWSIVVALLCAVALANMWIGDNAEFLYFQF